MNTRTSTVRNSFKSNDNQFGGMDNTVNKNLNVDVVTVPSPLNSCPYDLASGVDLEKFCRECRENISSDLILNTEESPVTTTEGTNDDEGV